MDNEKKNIDLSIVDTSDPDTETLFPLIERPIGSITYEHSLAERLFGDIYFGTAERNYFVDSNHELCLCAHFNRRIPGTYTFDNEYHFFVTKKRMCLDIYWHLGNITNEKMIVEKYVGLDNVKQSSYYDDFCDLVRAIESSIKWKKDHMRKPYDWGGTASFRYKSSSRNTEYEAFEEADKRRKQLVQFYFNETTQEWDLMSISKETISDVINFLDDFDELDEKVLHIREFIPIKENAIFITGKYHRMFKRAKDFHDQLHDDSIVHY